MKKLKSRYLLTKNIKFKDELDLILKKRGKTSGNQTLLLKNEMEMSSNDNSKFNMSIRVKEFEFDVSFVAARFPCIF